MNLKAQTEKLGCFICIRNRTKNLEKRNLHESFCYVTTHIKLHFSFFNIRSDNSSLQPVWGENPSSMREILLTLCLMQPVLTHTWFSPCFWGYCHHPICLCWYIFQMSWPSNVVLSIFLVLFLFISAPAKLMLPCVELYKYEFSWQ